MVGTVLDCDGVLFPVYKTVKEAAAKHPDADVMVNFASLRSAYDVTMDAMNSPSLKTIAIIAEGIPENYTRNIIKTANEKVRAHS